MEDKPTVPDVTEEPDSKPVSKGKVIEPTSDTPKATINVGTVSTSETTETTPPATSAPTSTPPPTPSKTEVQEWRSTRSGSPFTAPIFVFIASLLPVFALFCLFTFGLEEFDGASGVDLWIREVLPFALAAFAAVLAVKAYGRDTGAMIMVSLIISVYMLVQSSLSLGIHMYTYVRYEILKSDSSSSRYDY